MAQRPTEGLSPGPQGRYAAHAEMGMPRRPERNHGRIGPVVPRDSDWRNDRPASLKEAFARPATDRPDLLKHLRGEP